MRRVSKHGTSYSSGSEHGCASWQVPPVICIHCGKRVTLKQAWRGDRHKGTWHVACDPIRVRVLVDLGTRQIILNAERLS